VAIAQREQARTVDEETPMDRRGRGRAARSMIKEVRVTTDGWDQQDLNPHHQPGPAVRREPVGRVVLAPTEFL
jgi:hypothetical protein